MAKVHKQNRTNSTLIFFFFFDSVAQNPSARRKSLRDRMFLQIGLTYVNWLWEYLNAHRATAIIASFVLIPLITVVYNRRIHPLSKFPSPFFGSITDIYKTYLFSTKEFHLKSLALHEQYGQLWTKYLCIKITNSVGNQDHMSELRQIYFL